MWLIVIMDPGTILAILDIVNSSVQFLAGVVETLVDAPKGLTAIINETNQLQKLLEFLAGIQRELPLAEQRFLDGQVSTAECRVTVQDLWELVQKIRPLKSDISSSGDKMKFTDRVKWLLNKDKIEKLVEKLAEQAERLRRLLSSEQLVNLNNKVDRLLDAILLLMPKSAPAKELEFDSGSGVFSPYKADGIMWHGQFRCKPGQDPSLTYFRDRERLNDAAWAGDWDRFMKLLDVGRHEHKQVWANCRKIYRYDEQGKPPSGFTPLHQAAWHGNREAVQNLLKSGAWRLARTFRQSSSGLRKDSTPLDVARDHGWEHLYELLNPVIRRPISHRVLQALQDRLHDLIRKVYENDTEAHLDCFFFPELEILTEFDRSRLWFPLDPELRDTREGRAIHIVLDRDELVAIMRWGRQKRKNYRISVSGVHEIHQAVILN
ncbi:hypothetical protein HJFPF1_13153 [Paramyrothecium foliicola]|nr:hypothetical protein HJFPF1_13153 [Paramyrothecium foliicola]